MKRAVIVVGPANSGKSTTIRHLRKLLKMAGIHEFYLNGKWGYIMSSSFEESPKRDIEETVKKHSHYHYLVFASQGPKLARIHAALEKESFHIGYVRVTSPVEAPQRAKEVLKFLKS